ncbi:MAG: glucose 1-dehydrogenase [Rhodospirillales bacterium]|nr:glucose 1-dehydrogenase [Rhodospirillales bacterium]
MDAPLAHRIAIVTGGSSGIGAACALGLAEAGATVAVIYRSDAGGGEETGRRIRDSGGRAAVIRADVSDEDQVLALFDEVRERFGTVHILVNNAGIQIDVPFIDMSLQDWSRVIAVNLTGQFLCAREAAREFCRRGVDESGSRATGNIICMSSVHQQIPWACRANYAASKGGVRMLVETLAQELAPHRIRVNAVAPGAIRTDINRDAWETEDAEQQLLKLIPYGRIGDAEDVARAVVWLASDASDYVTGHSLVVDGGMLLYPAFREGG